MKDCKNGEIGKQNKNLNRRQTDETKTQKNTKKKKSKVNEENLKGRRG